LKIDFENGEIILNHSPFFYKKKLSCDDIIGIDVEKRKGYLIVSKRVPLNKWQKILSKGDDVCYKIHLNTVSADYIELLAEVFFVRHDSNKVVYD
jgi:hypothetical protein